MKDNMDWSEHIDTGHWSDMLKAVGAYSDCRSWARDKTYQQFWDTCEQSHWLISWITKEGSTDRKLITHTVCQCARLVLPSDLDDNKLACQAIETIEKWSKEKATMKEVSAVCEEIRLNNPFGETISILSYGIDNYADNVVFNSVLDRLSRLAGEASKNIHTQFLNIIRFAITRPDKEVSKFEQILRLKAFL